MITDYNLFLDDVRIPTHVTWVEIPANQHYSVVRNYKEFVDLISLRGFLLIRGMFSPNLD